MPNLENSTDYILMLDEGVSSNDIRGSLSENLLDLKAAELVTGGVVTYSTQESRFILLRADYEKCHI